MDESEEIILVRDIRLHERIGVGLLKFFGYGIGSIPMWPHLIKNGMKPNKRGFSEQSYSYIENNERIYRSMECKDKLYSTLNDIKTLNELLKKSASIYPYRKFLGRRQYISKVEEFDKVANKNIVKYEFGRFVWKTYSEILKEVENTCRKLIDIGVDSEKRVAVFASTSPEWLTIVLAALNINSPFITVYATLTDDSVSYALNLTNAYAVFVDEKTLPRIISIIPDVPSIKYVIMSSHIEPVIPQESYFSNNYELINFTSFQSYSSETDPNSRNPTDSEELAFIMFTSGSTGSPKGVMLSHKNMLSCIAAVHTVPSFSGYHIHAAFLPSSHIFELMVELSMISLQNTIGFCTPLTLFNTSPMIKEGTIGDLNVLRPTLLIAVPLFLERVKKAVIDNLKLKGRFKQVLFQTCYSIKTFYKKYGYETPLIDTIVFKPLRAIFGGKVRLGVIGGAYISKATEEFSANCFGNFKQGYGLTETSSAVIVTDPYYLVSGIAGRPMPHCEIKLLPWEEGNCDPNDSDTPKGELAVCSDCVAMGYYKNQELTDSSFIVDPVTGKRWFCTGDIAMVTKDKNFKIIDRKKDIIKLLHGEYVSLVKIEDKITQSLLTDFVCVLPNSDMSFLVALIVVNRESIKKFLIQRELADQNSNMEILLKDNTINQIVVDYIKDYAEKELTRHECPQKFYVLTDTWTPETSLITPTAKIRRVQIAKQYKHLLTYN